MILWNIFLDSLRPELSNDIYSPNGGRSLIKRVSEPGVPAGGFITFVDKRALKQDQTLHMEEKLQFILYFSTE